MQKKKDTCPELWDRFLLFEETNKLFDIKDSNNIYIWDIIRFDVYINILWEYPSSQNKKLTPDSLMRIIKKELSIIPLLFSRKKDVLLYLTSRNKVDNKFIDQNAYLALKTYPPQKRFIIESYPLNKNLKYFSESYIIPADLRLLKLFHRKYSYDFNDLYTKIKDEFPSINISVQHLNKIYNQFYFAKSIYASFLRRKKIKKIFLTQNGIQKGLIYAAKTLNIPIYEFQHGIVDPGHLAYSYPKDENIKHKSYLPDKIASLSSFWFNDLYTPGVKIIPIGNDFFYAERLPLSREKNLLVVSADIFGESLKKYLFNLIEKSVLLDYHIYFKLHPNQFHEYNQYKKHFEQYPNVSVLTNQKSIFELLKICNTLFTIQSTAIYEALQSGRKVLILTESSYKRQSHIFSNKNVYLVTNVSSFEMALDAPLLNEPVSFFMPGDSELFGKEFGQ